MRTEDFLRTASAPRGGPRRVASIDKRPNGTYRTPWREVQARLGHQSAMETLDTYGYLWPDAEDETRRAVDFAFTPLVERALAGASQPPIQEVGLQTVIACPARIASRPSGRIIEWPTLLAMASTDPEAGAASSGHTPARGATRLGEAEALRISVLATTSLTIG